MAYYLTTANIRLFSPKVYFDEQNVGAYHMERGMIRLTLGDGTPLTFPYQPGSKLPMMLTSSHFNNPTTKVGLTIEDTNMLDNLTVADEVNQSLTAAGKKLLLWHWKLGHTYMQRVQMMIITPQETSPHEQILFPKFKNLHPVIILFVLLAASPSQQDEIQALSKELTQVTVTSVKVTRNLEKSFY
jgi:hypothetical protein